MRLLLVEDSERLRDGIATGLRQAGYAVDPAATGAAALHLSSQHTYDLVLLDLMLPDIDGLTILKTLRANGSEVPVLILSARDAPRDLVAGLDIGADDYVVKPFLWDELKARVRALLRRRGTTRAAVLAAGALTLDVRSRSVIVDDVRITLSPRELAVLEVLMRRRPDVATHDEIEGAIYEADSKPTGPAVTTIVCRLRQRLAAVPAAPRVETVRGIGYRIDAS